MEERYTIEKLKSMDYGVRKIARVLKRDAGVISREFKHYGKHKKYDAKKAHQAAKKRKNNSANARKITDEMKRLVVSKLKQLHSPEQIVGALRLRKTRTPAPLVSVQWIYNFIRKDKKNGGKLHTYLRCQKKRRKRYGTSLKDSRGKIPGRRDISERPKIVDRRSRFGDWEGDLIVGAEHCQAIISLVERKTRYTILIKIPSKNADVTAQAIIRRFRQFGRRSHTITFDNGKEFARFKKIEKAFGVTIYFANPYASYERGTNENTNGLVRQRFPKKISFDIITSRQLGKFEVLLNTRPRKCLRFFTPQEKLLESIN